MHAAVVHDKPSGYSFLPELEGSKVDQVSIEAAQPKLDLAALKELPSKTIILGVIDLADLAKPWFTAWWAVSAMEERAGLTSFRAPGQGVVLVASI